MAESEGTDDDIHERNNDKKDDDVQLLVEQ